jgi:ubiquitin C-terminal hydrolase
MLACHELTAILNRGAKAAESAIFREYAELRQLVQTDAVPGRIIAPNKFVHFVQQVAAKKGRTLFTGWAQNDMSEFLIFVFDCIHESIARKVLMRIEGQPKNPTDHIAIAAYTMLKDVYSREYSELMETFYGIYITTFTATSGAGPSGGPRSTKPEQFFVLDLPIVGANAPLNNLYDCFDTFVAPEILQGENAYFDESANAKIAAEKRTVFWSFPQVLVITLNRFSAHRKLGHAVEFPVDDALDLSKYAVGYRSNNRYRLFAVCNHMGGTSGGHYTAHVKYGKTWYLCNDSAIATDDRISYSDAYCLFYRTEGAFGITEG